MVCEVRTHNGRQYESIEIITALRGGFSDMRSDFTVYKHFLFQLFG